MSNIKNRPINWRDLISLYRHRNKAILLDSEYALTRGNPIGFISLLSLLDPTYSRYIGVQKNHNGKITYFGHLHNNVGDKTTHLSYIIPTDISSDSDLIQLIDGLIEDAGSQGFYSLLVEIDETNPYFESFRKCGFSVYTWQRIWKLDVKERDNAHFQPEWEVSTLSHENNIQNLYQCLVPPIVQRAESLYAGRHSGLVYKQNGELLAFIKDSYGPEGIYLSPLIHPDIEDVSTLLQSLFSCLPDMPARPIYLAVRSYQSGIEYILEQMNSKPGPRHALMVKYLAAMSKVKELSLAHKVLENVRAEPTAPIVHQINSTDKRTLH